HGARSGNYDAPLALFTTAYLCAAYLCLARPGRPVVGWLVACAAGIVLAFLTKSVQGLLFLPGLAIYALVRGQGRAVLRLPATWASLAVACVLVAAFYAAREAVDPGYVSSALTNDVVGRYAHVIERHEGPWWFYLANQWLVVAGLVAAFLLVLSGTGERRTLGTFLLIVSACYLAIVSAAATKLWWYTIPVLPLSALAVAMGVDELLQRLQDAGSAAWRRRLPASAALIVLVAAGVVTQRALTGAHRLEAGLRQSERDHYSLILRSDALRTASVRAFDVAHPGYPAEHASYYAAPALFYVQELRRRGYVVNLAPPGEVWAGQGRYVVLCGSQVTEAVTAQLILAPLVRVASCGLFPRRPQKIQATALNRMNPRTT
ncbi:MAG TPA: glycosyltransferase family 39 protein, partial [Steroidobacteraceae bacterium]|nr:glycosyltransferase family 39 protein [Steroidobacteraceae bacterium]